MTLEWTPDQRQLVREMWLIHTELVTEVLPLEVC